MESFKDLIGQEGARRKADLQAKRDKQEQHRAEIERLEPVIATFGREAVDYLQKHNVTPVIFFQEATSEGEMSDVVGRGGWHLYRTGSHHMYDRSLDSLEYYGITIEGELVRANREVPEPDNPAIQDTMFTYHPVDLIAAKSMYDSGRVAESVVCLAQGEGPKNYAQTFYT